MESNRNIPATLATVLRAAVKDLRATGVPTGFASPGRVNVERAVNAIDSVEAAASELETLAQLPVSDNSDDAPGMNVDPKGMARSLHDAADSITCNTNAVNEVPDALDAIRLVAVTLENVIEPKAIAGEGPDEWDALDWYFKRVINTDEEPGRKCIEWIPGSDFVRDARWTEGGTWRDAITKAMAEDAAGERAGVTT